MTLIITKQEQAFQNEEKEKRAAELMIANKELAFQNNEREKRAAELIVANKELIFQNEEKEKRAAELILANKELAFQNNEKEKRAAELTVANKELAFQNNEKEKRAAELVVANNELAFQNDEKGKRAAELTIANKELAFQNNEKEKRAAELIVANKELAFQNNEKEKRAAELTVANRELAFQNNEKEKRAAELVVANEELAFQNDEKEKRAAELIVANKELAFQNNEKEKRAEELTVANKELVFQNEEKEKRAAELIFANKELAQFAYIASHDLQEPLRTVSNYMLVFEEDYIGQLDDNARNYLHSVNNATKRMSTLIKSLLDFSRLGYNKKLAYVDCKKLIGDVLSDLGIMIKTSSAVIEVTEMPQLNLYEIEIRQVFQNLITNAVKFHKKGTPPKIKIGSEEINETWRFSVSDLGIGIAAAHFERIFDIFQRLHTNEKIEGSGIGLANCKKIVQLHGGEIWVESKLGQGTTFYFTIPNLTL
ncbi:MAG TPA: ATP-binding protein [Puia sp.]|nr:ATP-binding protein [Puia sp.]